MTKQDESDILYLGNIVSPKKSYFAHNLGNHIIPYGVAVGKTITNFIRIDDIHGNTSYMKITELDKIGK